MQHSLFSIWWWFSTKFGLGKITKQVLLLFLLAAEGWSFVAIPNAISDSKKKIYF